MKKMTKKMIALFMTLLMVAAILPITASAGQYARIVVELKEPYYGENLAEILPEIEDRTCVVSQGDVIHIDEVKIEFIFSYHEELTNNLMNDSSLVFKLSTPNKSVMFLGDIGPDAGDLLYFESKDKLKADMVQMAHHGGLCCGMEVYAAIKPEVCLWCCREESYNGKSIPKVYFDKEKMKELGWIRMHPIPVTREWMEALGVKKHYVTKDGTNKIIL